MKVAACLALLLAAARAAPDAPLSPREIDALVAQLGSDTIRARQEAREKLAAADEAARPAIERALAHPDPEVARAARDLLARMDSIPAQLVRIGRRGIRKDLLGERWFTAWEDGQVRGAARFRLEEGPGGTYALNLETFHPDAGRRVRTATLSSRFSESPDAPPALGWLVWFFPFRELAFPDAPQAVPQAPDGAVRLGREGPQEIPVPGGQARGESVRVEDSEGRVVAQVWWDAEGRTLRLLVDAIDYYPATPEEARKATGGKLE